jgi:hypothetical protein
MALMRAAMVDGQARQLYNQGDLTSLFQYIEPKSMVVILQILDPAIDDNVIALR